MPHRSATVFVEKTPVLQQREYPQRQRVLRLYAPRCATAAKPGQFVHLQCDPGLRMRRPYSIMSTSVSRGWIEILYKIVGHGSDLLAKKKQGDLLNAVGPIGNGFTTHYEFPRLLLLGGGVGVPPVFFLAKSLEKHRSFSPVAIFASESAFPFSICESKINIAGLDEKHRATHAELEAIGIPARLCSKRPYPGCFNGFAHEIADVWLSRLNDTDRSQVEIFACGPTPMLRKVACLALKYALPCQLALEEYMACGLGGCAGCTVPVMELNRVVMKRVCVDGPVFNAESLRF